MWPVCDEYDEYDELIQDGSRTEVVPIVALVRVDNNRMDEPTNAIFDPLSDDVVTSADTELKQKQTLSRYITVEEGLRRGIAKHFETRWGVPVATIRVWAKRLFESML